jgi:hypothetical protein
MKKLIICIDGLGKDLISKENTPFLYKYGMENYFSELETFFAFTGLEYSFFTGKTPRELGVWLEFIRKENSLFDNPFLKILPRKLGDYLAVLLQLKGRTWISSLHNIPKNKLKYFDTAVRNNLWKLDYFQNRDFVFYKWPFFVYKDKVEKRRIIPKYENDKERLRRLLKIRNKEVYYTQLMEIDKVLHKYGKSKKAEEKIREIDELLGKTIRKLGEDWEILLWSDHGFSDIKEYIDLRDILPKKMVYFLGGTTLHLWFDKGGEGIIEKLENRGLKRLDKKKAKKFKIPFNYKYGEEVFYVEKGGYFFPNFYQEKKFKGMHGYPPNKELNGIVISNKKIPKKLRIDGVINLLK